MVIHYIYSIKKKMFVYLAIALWAQLASSQIIFPDSPILQKGDCRTPTGSIGLCGPFSDCQAFTPFVSQLSDPKVVQLLKTYICGQPNRGVNLCCPLDLNVPTIPPREIPIPDQAISKMIPSEKQCGQPNDIRIIGGTELEPGRWPWLAAVGKIINSRFNIVCGGSLITRRHVLSASHCFPERNSPTHVRLGDHHLNNDSDGLTPEDFQIVNRVGNGYDKRSLQNDIALLTLDRDVTFTEYIQPICLPYQFRNDQFVSERLHIAGWGRTSTEVISDTPNEAVVEGVSLQECKEVYNRHRRLSVIDNKHICAGKGGQDTCSGDSGGPLAHVDLRKGKYYLVGIVSYGPNNCGVKSVPAVYTKVSAFLDWIEENV